MRCTQEQFNAIKPKLRGLMIERIDYFTVYNYLVNNLIGKTKIISNVMNHSKGDYNREVHEEWNERIFLQACGIIPCTIQDRLANLEKEIKEVKASIEEENKPKIGDICKFWDDDKSIFIVGKLESVKETELYPYCIHGVGFNIGFKNCEKITDENFLKSFNDL